MAGNYKSHGLTLVYKQGTMVVLDILVIFVFFNVFKFLCIFR